MTFRTRLLVSSVVRGSRQGDSHGGLYLVDLERETHEQVLDWNAGHINFDGRGADRGLRGIAVHEDQVFVAASDELFVLNLRFEIVASYRNAYLKHCHEIAIHRGGLYLTSTGFDSILRFDLAARTFDRALRLMRQPNGLATKLFDPQVPGGAPPSNEFHLNNVFVDDTATYVAGRELAALVRIGSNQMSIVAPLPLGTHNARPFGAGVLVNDTESDCVRWIRPRPIAIPVPRYAETDLLCADFDDTGIARQAFGRGLCPLSDTIVAGGSSPTTVSIYDLSSGQRLRSINVTMDVRNAAHGMTVWPF